MGRLLLVRHAESEGNRDRIFTLTPLVPLTEAGHEQARTTAEWLRARYAPRLLVSSPFVRARQTAGIIGRVLDLVCSVEDDLQERSYGDFSGKPYDTPRPDYDPQAYWTWRPPGGETLDEVVARVGPVLDRVAAGAGDGDAVVVSHGAVMMALYRHVTGVWPMPARVVRNAGVLLVEHRRGTYRAATLLEAP